MFVPHPACVDSEGQRRAAKPRGLVEDIPQDLSENPAPDSHFRAEVLALGGDTRLIQTISKPKEE